ncbi:MAG TPA: NAD(+) synthase [Clostridiaceae bacterium]
MNFIRVGAACPKTDVGNITYNIVNIMECINKASKESCKLLVFPELSVTSYTCGDIFLQDQLLQVSSNGIHDLVKYSTNFDLLIAVGAPFKFKNCLYNCAFIIFKGKILGIIPKSYIPNYTEYYEKRWFTEGLGLINKVISLPYQKDIPFGCDIIFSYKDINFGFEICEDLWVTIPPSSYLSLGGAQIIGNLSASNEIVSKAAYRRALIENQSGRCISSYVYASCGVLESTTDLVFSGHMLICENGSLLKENSRFQRDNSIITSIIDVDKLNHDRLTNISFRDGQRYDNLSYRNVSFNFESLSYGKFDRMVTKHPFVPSDELNRESVCQEIFDIQVAALAKRIEKTTLSKAIIGISGGLDSTLALLVTVKTFKLLNIPWTNIITITLPGFGTSDRTYQNAIALCKNLATDFREINIQDACLQHFNDIGQDASKLDVTYENVQARERTQILMDIANKEGGLVIGTGDLSEIAQGWSTYNGDHMSMYGVNCSIPKTLVRYLVKYVAQKEMDEMTADILMDILDTPVSPELLPKNAKGEISQKTEDIIGPYELHDFFLYYFVRQGSSKEKILFLAQEAFNGEYDSTTIEKWFNSFIKRFFSQQFKRSAIPDGPKVGTISLSPRGDWRMPSDGSWDAWK